MTLDEAIKDMRLNPDEVVFVTDIDSLKTGDAIWAALEAKKSQSMAIHGNAKPANLIGIDIYDIVLKFAEDNFYRMRGAKQANGDYAVIVSEIINDTDE